MKKHYILFLAIFVMMIFLPAPVFFLFREQIGYKNTENKAEEAFPELSRANFSTWPKRFEEWFSDVLPFKTQFIELYRGFQYYTGSDFSQSDVIRGEGDILFYRKTVENYKGISRFSADELKMIEKNLNGFISNMEKQGTKCLFYIAPDKEQVYSSRMPTFIRRMSSESRGDQVINYLTDNVEFPVLYPKEKFIELNKSYPTYYITDTHWNDLGGWVAANQIKSIFTGDPESSELPKYHFYENEGKDLAGMLGLSDMIQEQNAVQVDHDDNFQIWKPETIDHGKIQRFISESPVNKKLMIIGDSFSEYFMRSAIHDLEEIIFVTYGYLHLIDYEAEKPDYLVIMLVERNLPFLLNGFY